MKLNSPFRTPPLLLSVLFLTFPAHRSRGAILYSENFDGVTLGANKEEGITTGDGERKAQTAVWTKTAPAGWTVDDSQMQGLGDPTTDGVVEWAGWSFTDPRWWAYTAGNQNRTSFVKGGGAIAVTDPDEWDDLTRNGPYNSYLVSPRIPVAAAAGAELTLRFDSSWRPEVPQKAVILVSWDNGAFTEILRWEGAGDKLHPEGMENETVYLTLTPPPGAQNAQFRFGTIDAGNNWWWAIDNLALYSGAEPPHFETHPVSPADTNVSSSFIVGTGAAVDLAVSMDGTPAAGTLQWVRMNGATRTVLTGQTAETLSLPSAVLADSGLYLCEATNAAGTIKSAPVLMTVAGFTVTEQPLAQTVAATFPAAFTVAADSTFALTYQWFKGPEATRVEIPGATSSTLSFAAAALADDGVYSVRISGTTGTVPFSGFSNVARLSVQPLLIDQPPASTEAAQGEAASFEVVASSTGTPTYQWLFRAIGQAGPAAPVDGATGSTLSLTSASRFGTGYYSVRVTNPLGSVTSPEAKLTVHVPPSTTEIFKENWQSVALGPNVEEGILTGAGFPAPQTAVWSPAAPNGWTIDNSAMPVPSPENVSGTDGVKEWFGWSFAEPGWWSTTAGEQGRSGFSKGLGDSAETGIPAVVAIADTDEWDDLAHTGGAFSSALISPSISLAGTTPGSVVLSFDSCWQREGNMKAILEVSLDGGPYQQVLFWTDSGPDTHDNNTDETVTIPISTTAANTSLKLRYSLVDATNNWYWAIDNIQVTAATTAVPGVPPVITSMNFNAATKVITLKWKSVPQKAYKLQYSQNLQTWQTAVPNLTGAAGAETEVSSDVDTLFPTPPVPGKLFFRISE
ncbi:MAG: hypothetical protein V4726_01405 [Verrucomicrobiota bacterium]